MGATINQCLPIGLPGGAWACESHHSTMQSMPILAAQPPSLPSCLVNLEKSAQLLAGLDALLERLDRDADVRELEEQAEADAAAEAGQASSLGLGAWGWC